MKLDGRHVRPLKSEIARWTKVARKAGLKPE
jgi:hypothetical protein